MTIIVACRNLETPRRKNLILTVWPKALEKEHQLEISYILQHFVQDKNTRLFVIFEISNFFITCIFMALVTFVVSVTTFTLTCPIIAFKHKDKTCFQFSNFPPSQSLILSPIKQGHFFVIGLHFP